MTHDRQSENRRGFLRRAGQAGAVIAGAHLGFGQSRRAVVSIVLDPSEPLASAAPVRWALAQLEQALTHAGYTVQHRENISQAGADEPTVMIAGSSSPGAVAALQRARIEAPRSPETLAIANTSASGRSAVLGLILATTIVRRFSRLPIWPYLTPIPSRIARRRRSSIWKRP